MSDHLTPAARRDELLAQLHRSLADQARDNPSGVFNGLAVLTMAVATLACHLPAPRTLELATRIRDIGGDQWLVDLTARIMETAAEAHAAAGRRALEAIEAANLDHEIRQAAGMVG